MKKTLNEAKKGGRILSPGAPGAIRSSGFINPANVDAHGKSSGMPTDRGITDQKRLYNLFTTAFKLIHRHGKGGELENVLEKGLGYLNRLQSAARILSDRKKYAQYDAGTYLQDAKDNKGQILELYSDIENYLGKLIKQTVAQIYLKASPQDKKVVATLKSLDDIPADLQTIKQDEAELISEIFFRNGQKATSQEVADKVKTIVNSFVKLDKEVMDDMDTIHNILTRLKTVSKTAKLEQDFIKTSRPKGPVADPSAGYKSRDIDIAVKRKITSAFASGDLQEVKAQLAAVGRDDLASQVGSKSEAAIMKAYITGNPINENFAFQYDLEINRLFNSF